MEHSTDMLEDGSRVGRYLVLVDVDGHVHAVSSGAVSVLTATDDGTILLLPAGRLLHIPRPLSTLLRWLDGRS